MKVKFEFFEEVDLVDAPEGWRWVGTIGHRIKHVLLWQMVTTLAPQAWGGICMHESGVSAGHTPAGGEYQVLGKFHDTRAASVALIHAMGLEVQS